MRYSLTYHLICLTDFLTLSSYCFYSFSMSKFAINAFFFVPGSICTHSLVVKYVSPLPTSRVSVVDGAHCNETHFVQVCFPSYQSPATMTSSNGNIFLALPTFCAENSPVTGEFHAQRPVTRSFDVIFDLSLNKRLSIHAGDSRRHRAHYAITVMDWLGIERVPYDESKQYQTLQHVSLFPWF